VQTRSRCALDAVAREGFSLGLPAFPESAMALKIVRAKNLPIGLDLGSSRIKMVQLRQTDQDYELVAADWAQVPPSCRADAKQRLRFLTGAIRKILASNRFQGKKCVMSLPAEATFLQHVKVPKLPPEQTAQAVLQELEGKLPYPLGEAVVRHMTAGDIFGDDEAKQEVIVVAVWRPVLEAYLSMADRGKLDVVGVNVESCAIVECFAHILRRANDAASATLFVDMGASSTRVVLCLGSRVVFARNLAAGGDKIDQAVAEGMHVSLEQARAVRQDLLADTADATARDELYRLLDGTIRSICDEMTQCLRYYESVFRDSSVGRAIFVGGQAYDKRLCQAIAQRLNLPAQIGNPLVRIRRAEGAGVNAGLDWRQPQPAWAVAVGLSLGATLAA
jgi:type IV pilus assembly protein PilM